MTKDFLAAVREKANTRLQSKDLKDAGYRGRGVGFSSGFSSGDVTLWIPTGVVLLDFMMGGGFPAGRISEVFSNHTSEGKTTTALHAAAQTQRRNGAVWWGEAEVALGKRRGVDIGVDWSKVLMPAGESEETEGIVDTVEDLFLELREVLRGMKDLAFEAAAEEYLQCNPRKKNAPPREELNPKRPEFPSFFVWDTLASTVCEAERYGDNPFAGGIQKRARAVSEGIRVVKNDLFRQNAHFAILNQSYTKINTGLSYPTYETAGGVAVRQYATMRLKLAKKGYLSEAAKYAKEKEKLGILVEAEMVKNKLAPPYRTVLLALDGPTGFNNALSCAHYYSETRQTDMIQAAGSRYRLAGTDRSCYWKDIPELIASEPNVMLWWIQRAAEMFPLPPDRWYNPETGWVERIEGAELVETQGEGENELPSPDTPIVIPGGEPLQKKGKKKKGKKK